MPDIHSTCTGHFIDGCKHICFMKFIDAVLCSNLDLLCISFEENCRLTMNRMCLKSHQKSQSSHSSERQIGQIVSRVKKQKQTRTTKPSMQTNVDVSWKTGGGRQSWPLMLLVVGDSHDVGGRRQSWPLMLVVGDSLGH